MKNKIISLILLLAMSVSIVATLASCSEPEAEAPDALVIMTEELDGLFSPFFSTSGTDATIVGMTQISMLTYGYANGRVSPAWGDKEAVVTEGDRRGGRNQPKIFGVHYDHPVQGGLCGCGSWQRRRLPAESGA